MHVATPYAKPTADAPAPSAVLDAEKSDLGGGGYLEELLAHGLLVSTGVEGLYGRSAVFEDVVEHISALVGAWGSDRPVEVLRFPPAMSRKLLEDSGYLRNFPDQVGSVFTFCGNDRDHSRLLRCLDKQEDWTESLSMTRVVMTPVACYPVYPVMAARGPLPQEGRTIDIFSYCFRHEPSFEPERMQLFRQREFVRMGTPLQIEEFLQEMIGLAKETIQALGLPATIAVASDAFFGRTGKVVADSQRHQRLKFELLIPAINPDKPTACCSFNNHTDCFGKIWQILGATGEVAHTGCCGFGLERIALSLFRHHGFDIDGWPESVRATLWPT